MSGALTRARPTVLDGPPEVARLMIPWLAYASPESTSHVENIRNISGPCKHASIENAIAPLVSMNMVRVATLLVGYRSCALSECELSKSRPNLPIGARYEQ